MSSLMGAVAEMNKGASILPLGRPLIAHGSRLGRLRHDAASASSRTSRMLMLPIPSASVSTYVRNALWPVRLPRHPVFGTILDSWPISP